MWKPRIVIVGASGHGKVLLDALAAEGVFHVEGFIDAHKEPGLLVLGVPILGREEDLPELIRLRNIEACAIGVGDNHRRELVYEKVRAIAPGLEFPAVIHPSAVVSRSATIGDGTVVCARATVGPACETGRFCLLNTGSSLDHDGRLHDFASLAPGVMTGGEVTIGRATAIGIGATLRHRIEIGENTVVGARSLVMSSLPSGVVAYGSPAKVVRTRNPETPYL